MSRLIVLLLPILGVYAKTGEEIADSLYQHPNECKDPSDGGIWAPLQGENPSCGAAPCNYPQQWCSATSDPSKNQNTPNLNCVNLPPDCQAVLGQSATTTTVAAASTSTATTTTSPSISSTTSASTPSTQGQSRASGAPVTAAPGGTTPAAGGCKDGHDYCCFWASKQQCDQNPRWMRTNCQSSCGTCGCQASQFQSCKVTVNTNGCKYLNGGGGNRVRVVLGGGPGLAAMGFGNPGAQSGAGSMVGGMPGLNPQQGAMSSVPSRRVVVPLGGGPSPFAAFGSNNGNNGTGSNWRNPGGNGMTPGGQPAGGNGGQSPTMVTIPVGRKRRHFMPRWFNNV